MIKDIVYTISLVPDLLERSTYLQQCSNLLQVDEVVLSNALKKQLRQNSFDKAKKEQSQEENIEIYLPTDQPVLPKQQIDSVVANPDYEQEKSIISILLKYGENSSPTLWGHLYGGLV